jgi:hypothetical protein
VTGTINQAGVDTVLACFSAPQGTSLEITVQAGRGSSLRPTVLLRNAAGEQVAARTRSIGWLPGGTTILYAQIEISGNYCAEYGGSSGSGSFWSRIGGTVPPGSQQTTLSGIVSDSLTGDPIEGVEVYAEQSLFAITDDTGAYSGQLFPGSYAVSYQADGFNSSVEPVEIVAGMPLVVNTRSPGPRSSAFRSPSAHPRQTKGPEFR